MNLEHKWILCIVILGLGSLPLSTSLAQDVVWTDITDDILGGDGDGEAVGWGDYDNDGDLDLYDANWGANRLLRNNGPAGFEDVTQPPLDDAGFAKSITWIDYDNDGDLDLYIANYTQDNKLFQNQYPEPGFLDVSPEAFSSPFGAAGAAWADYDRDGLPDLFVSTPNSYGAPEDCKLFRNEGGGTFSDATAPAMEGGTWYQGTVWADYDNDGDQDLYVTRFIGANRLFRNDDGVFVDIAASLLVDLPDANSVAAAWGDHDNDGDLDLYVTNWGPNNLFRNEGDGTFLDVTSPPLDAPGNTTSASWFDHDNDGDLDLYLATLGNNLLLCNQGGGVFTDASAPPIDYADVTWGVAVGDQDQDGDLDLYLANGTYGAKGGDGFVAPGVQRPGDDGSRDGVVNCLFRNECANGNHWLHLRLEGQTSCRSAVGARVRCVTGDLVQIREVSGSTSYWSYDSLEIEFGLGAAASVDSLVVRWPSGAIDLFLDGPVDMLLHITEGMTTGVADDGLPGDGSIAAAPAPVLHAAYPNPFNPITTIGYELTGPSLVTVSIVTPAGEHVCDLVSGLSQQRGLHRLTWNGCDDRGLPVPAGAYLSVLRVDGKLLARKLVLVK